MKNTIYSTIADRNTLEAYNFLSKNGYNNLKKDKGVVALALADYIHKNQESGMPTLVELHPDRELFKNHHSKEHKETRPQEIITEHQSGPDGEEIITEYHPSQEGVMKNCDACPLKNADGSGNLNASSPTTPKPEVKKFALSEKAINILMISGAAVLIFAAAAVIIKKIK